MSNNIGNMSKKIAGAAKQPTEQQGVQLKDLSVDQLQAACYQQIKLTQQCQANIAALEQEIAARSQAASKVLSNGNGTVSAE